MILKKPFTVLVNSFSSEIDTTLAELKNFGQGRIKTTLAILSEQEIQMVLISNELENIVPFRLDRQSKYRRPEA